MASVVHEIMNEELYAIGCRETVAETVSAIIALEITAVPVIDSRRRPIGMVTLRALLDAPPDSVAAESATASFAVVERGDSVATAAKKMAISGEHQLVVVDVEGRAVGIVSAIDLVRAMVGVPIERPPAFSHFDEATGVPWTDDAPLDADHADEVEPAPGVVAYVLGGVGARERIIAVESTGDLRARLAKVVARPLRELPALARALATKKIRFRIAVVPDGVERARVHALILARALAEIHAGPPGSA